MPTCPAHILHMLTSMTSDLKKNLIMIAGDGCLFVQTSLVAIMMMKKMDSRRRRMVCGVERWVRAELPPPLSPQQSSRAAEHKQPRQSRAQAAEAD